MGGSTDVAMPLPWRGRGMRVHVEREHGRRAVLTKVSSNLELVFVCIEPIATLLSCEITEEGCERIVQPWGLAGQEDLVVRTLAEL